MPDQLNLPLQTRRVNGAEFDIRKSDDGGTTKFSMSLSSEYPVERYWGKEILSHDSSAVRLDRADGGAMPLLWNHNPDDPIGMVSSAKISGKRLLVEGSFFNTQRAKDVASMVEGGLRNVSVGYRIHSVEENVDEDEFTVTDWEPYEASIAPVPADPTVGSGRAAGEQTFEVKKKVRDGKETQATEVPKQGERSGVEQALKPSIDPAKEVEAYKEAIRAGFKSVADTIERAILPDKSGLPDKPNTESPEPRSERGSSFSDSETVRANPEVPAVPASPTVKVEIMSDVKASAGDAERKVTAVEAETERRNAIQSLCKAAKIDARVERQWIEDATPLTDKVRADGTVETVGVASQILQVQELRARSAPVSASKLGIGTRETERYSLFKVIRALRYGGQQPKLLEEAAYELECSRAIGKQLGRNLTSSILIPGEVLERPLGAAAERAMATQPGAKGGFMVNVQNMGFIDILRNRSVAMAMGARVMSGLQGNVTFPRQTGKVSVTWQAGEGTSVTAADQALGQLSMTPKTCIAITDVSEQLLAQATPSAEAFVMADWPTMWRSTAWMRP
jgi:HK97 family phage major capsid protein/HK97 family phage prohead protease